MNRRSFVQSGSMALSVASMAPWWSHIFPKPAEMILMRRNVGLYRESGGTIGWLVQPQGIAVVDSQFPEQADHLIDLIMKGSMKPIQWLINTHHHGDHTSGNISFKGIADHVLAHENSKINQMNSAKKNNNEAEQLYPDTTYTERWQQSVGDELIDIQYWGPAHTNGDSIIHFQKANIVHVGDLVFNRRYPYIDRSAGANIENWISILQNMQSYFDSDALFIFGHAADGYDVKGNKDDLAAFADYLTALLEFVDIQIKTGKSKDEIMLATQIPGITEWKGDGIQRSLSAAYEELVNK